MPKSQTLFCFFSVSNPKGKERMISNENEPVQGESVKASAGDASSHRAVIVNTYDPKAIA